MEEELSDTLTDRQIYQVRQQILAYKYLIRNLSIAPDVERNLLSLSKEQWEIEKERVFTRSLRFYNDKVEKNEELKRLIQDKLVRRNGEGELAEQAQLQVEKTLFKYFIDKRKNEIMRLLEQEHLPDEVKVKLQCELRFLGLRDFYMALKDRVLGTAHKKTRNYRIIEKQMLDRKYFKREKPHARNESRMNERIEHHLRNEQERRRQVKHKEFLKYAFQHQAEFFEFHKKKVKTAKKRASHARAYLEQLERRKQTLSEQQDKERIRALKTNNMEDYLNKIKEIKNERIIELLKQTDGFLRELGAKVLVQKGENPEEQDEELRFSTKGEDFVMNLKNSNKVYYNLTHAKKEEIRVQPTLLEGGTLKS